MSTSSPADVQGLASTGQSVIFYKIRKIYVPKGILKWVPKNSMNSKDTNDSIKANGPKFVRGDQILLLDIVFV